MKRRSATLLIFVLLLIGSDVSLIYKIITEETAESNVTTTSFTVSTRSVTHELTGPNESSPEITFSDDTTVATKTTTNEPRTTFSTATITNEPSMNATSATSPSSSVTAVTSQTTKATVETRATTLTTKESSNTTAPIVTLVPKSTTRITTTTNPPRTERPTAETPARTFPGTPGTISSTSSSPNATAVTSQTTEATVVTRATTLTTNAHTTVTTKESSSTTAPTVTIVPKSTTQIATTTDSLRTGETPSETPTANTFPKTSGTASWRTTTKSESTKIVTTTEATTDVDTTTHATATPCDTFDYVARDMDTAVACVWANMTVQVNLRHATNDSRVNEATLTVPKEAKVSGVCSEETAEMTLSWKEAVDNPADSDIKENKITFRYAHDSSTYFLDSASVDVYLDKENFSNAQRKRVREDTTDRHLRLFPTSMKHVAVIRQLSTKINVGDQVNILISDISLIAFTGCSKASSRTDGDHIARESVKNGAIVGGTIGTGALILVVFFLIWRKRKKSTARSERHLP